MTSPSSSETAVTRRGLGTSLRTRLWYLVAMKRPGTPSKSLDLRLTAIGLSFPCIILLALDILAPNACPITWCPRHMPRMGTSYPSSLTTSSDIPTSSLLSGVPGPGDITILSGLILLIPETVISSFLTTRGLLPRDPTTCAMLYTKLS